MSKSASDKALPLQAFESVLDNIRYYIYAVNPETGAIIFANQAFCSAFGSDCLGKPAADYIALSDGNIKDTLFYDVYLAEREQWLSVSRRRVHWLDGQSVYLYTCHDNTAHKQCERRIESQAFHDYLTGLPNRHYCDSFMNEMLKKNSLVMAPHYLFFIDLDDFKIVNDGFGHDYGDSVLISFADYLRRAFTGKNKIFRLGGDEFVIIIDPENGLNVPEYLEDLLVRSTRPWPALDKEFYCSLSIGVVEFIPRFESAGSILKKADLAMYHAKKTGKNSYAYYSEGMDSDIIKRSTMEPLLRKAMRDDCAGFEILYQPYCSTQDEKIIGAEALLRLRGDDGELILPRDFIELMEYLGLIVPVSEHVLFSAARLCKEINQTLPDFSLTVNLSPVQFRQNDIVRKMEKILRSSGVNLSNMIIGINEKVALEERRQILNLCSELRRHGIRVALDDFGSGNASFINMRRLPVDIIKVAPAFVQDPEDDFSKRLLKLIIELGHISSKKICLTGVETAGQLAYCKRKGADCVQGFYLHRPQPAAELKGALFK